MHVPERPQRVLVVMAHPDDAEFICAGTVARWASEGSEIVYVLVTSGDKGSNDPTMTPERLAELREAEQLEAARILGVAHVEFLRYRDAEVVADRRLRRELVRAIRRFKPDAVICQDPTSRYFGQEYIQHPDHIAVGEATLAAVFPSARDRLTFPELVEEGLEPHVVRYVYLTGSREPDVFVDITEVFERKIAALRAHRSQLGDWDPEPVLRLWAQDTAAEARRKGWPGGERMLLAESFKFFDLGD
ncbi:MAG: PIG-L deacetylase family protein [Thermomicrobium sp.]|nr:PIG-L deacetylase family protein [Thermomicrobium sp.]